MSQTSKHMQWCLNKATKEIEECKRLGMRQKHRGLTKGKANVSEAKRHLLKAEHNLKAITEFQKIGYSDWSVSAAFYSIYHCFLAIGYWFGYESRNQSCTISLMKHLVAEGKIKLDLEHIKLLESKEMGESSVIDLREDYTYGFQTSVKNTKQLDTLKGVCYEVIRQTKEIVL